MGPDVILGAAVSLTLTSIDNHHLVDLAVIVPVVLSPVFHQILSQFHSLDNQVLSPLVISILVVLAIILDFLADGDRANDVESQFKLITRLVSEIVGYRTHKTVVVRIARCVGDVFVERHIVFFTEFHVLKIHQQYQALLRSEMNRINHTLLCDFTTIGLKSRFRQTGSAPPLCKSALPNSDLACSRRQFLEPAIGQCIASTV